MPKCAKSRDQEYQGHSTLWFFSKAPGSEQLAKSIAAVNGAALEFSLGNCSKSFGFWIQESR
jgi:hypothetical protein